MGIFSLLDAILDRELGEILAQMPIQADIKAALLGEENQLREVYHCALSYEKADWEELPRTSGQTLAGFAAALPRLYLDAISWTDKSFTAAARAA